MEFKDLFNLEIIQNTEPEEVLDAAVQSIFDLDPIILNSVEMNELVYEMRKKADFEKVEPHINYEEQNGTYVITVPSFDERKLPEFQVSLFQKKVVDVFPERGFYIIGNSKLITKPLGLVQVEMTGLPSIRVDKDIRYTQTSNDIRGRGYRENLYFYFDYNTKNFERVYGDKLEECKLKIERDPNKSENILKDYHESVQEYIKREQLLDAVDEKIYPLVLAYLPKLKEWKDFEYGSRGVTIGSVKRYLNQYKDFLEETMTRGLKVKLIYSNVSKREYEELMKKKDELLNMISSSFLGLKAIETLHSLTEEMTNNYELSKGAFNSNEVEIVKTIEDDILRSLQQFKEVRPTTLPETALNESKILKGYIGYDLKTNQVFPNIMQLQRRSSLTEEKEDFNTEKEYTDQMIEELKNLKKK